MDKCVKMICEEYGLFDAEHNWGGEKKGLVGLWAAARREIADKANDLIGRAERKKREAQRKKQTADSAFDDDRPTRVQLDKSFGVRRRRALIVHRRTR
jgi:hypothetical protein